MSERHALNLSGYPQELTVAFRGDPLLGGSVLRLPGRRGLMLPLSLTVDGFEVAYATAEPVGGGTFRALTPGALVAIRGDVTCGDALTEVRRADGLTVVTARAAGEFTVTRAGSLP
jgi:hypothetical protein